MLDSYRRSKALNFPVGSQLILEGKSQAVLSGMMFKCFMFKGMIIGNAGFQTSASLLPWVPQLLQVHAEMQQYWPLSIWNCFLILPCDKKLTIESKHFVPSTQIGYRHHGKMHRSGPLHNWWVLSHSSTYILQPAFCIIDARALLCMADLRDFWQTSQYVLLATVVRFDYRGENIAALFKQQSAGI